MYYSFYDTKTKYEKIFQCTDSYYVYDYLYNIIFGGLVENCHQGT